MKLLPFILCLQVYLAGAQSPQRQKSLENKEGIISEPGVYYVDDDNVFDGFEGTYEFSNSEFTFTVNLKKKTKSSQNNIYWTDLLIGGYKYSNPRASIEVDCLNDIDKVSSVTNGYQLNLLISTIYPETLNYFCKDCLCEKYVVGSIRDPLSQNWAYIFIAKKVLNHEKGIEIWIYREIPMVTDDTYSDTSLRIPQGKFFLKEIH